MHQPDVAGKLQLSSYQLTITYTAVAGGTWASIDSVGPQGSDP
jgi:hypothetical protein